MGVPLEEMDAVFGEGAINKESNEEQYLYCLGFIDEQEEQFDNESERTSLVSAPLPTNHQAIPPSRSRHPQGWFSRLLNGRDHRASYEAIGPNNE